MEVIQKLMNYVVAPIFLIIMALSLPFFLIFKLVDTILRSFSSENMTGKVVLITGASSGIGEHLAYEYAKRGAFLAIVARRENSLREVAEKARGFGSPDVLIVRADVSKVDDCKRFVEETVNHFGRLDHLVNNAGIYSGLTFEESTNISNFTTIMDVNFWGSIYPTYFALPYLKKSKGNILIIASVSGWFYSPRLSFYGASKGALINFFDSMRIELGPTITITIASPGFVESEMTRGKHLSNKGSIEVDQEARDMLIGAFPVQSTEECAKTMVKGACRGDRYVTEPSWFRLLFLAKILYPDVVEWVSRLLYMADPGSTNKNAANKRMLDSIGAMKFFQPPTVESTEIKAD